MIAVYPSGNSSPLATEPPIWIPIYNPVEDFVAEFEINTVILSWSAPMAQNHGEVTGYRILKSSNGFPAVEIANISMLMQAGRLRSQLLQYSDTDVNPNIEYTYLIIAE